MTIDKLLDCSRRSIVQFLGTLKQAELQIRADDHCVSCTQHIPFREVRIAEGSLSLLPRTAGAPRRSDQIVPYVAAGPLSAKLLKNGTLITYKDFPHGMPTTHAEKINADLLAFLKG